MNNNTIKLKPNETPTFRSKRKTEILASNSLEYKFGHYQLLSKYEHNVIHTNCTNLFKHNLNKYDQDTELGQVSHIIHSSYANLPTLPDSLTGYYGGCFVEMADAIFCSWLPQAFPGTRFSNLSWHTPSNYLERNFIVCDAEDNSKRLKIIVCLNKNCRNHICFFDEQQFLMYDIISALENDLITHYHDYFRK